MSEAFDTAASVGFAIANPAFAAFQAVATFIGSKPSQSRADRGAILSLVNFLADTGYALPPAVTKGKARQVTVKSSPFKKTEDRLRQARGTPRYDAALAAAAELGWTTDPARLLSAVNRETLRDKPEIAAELFALAVGRASLAGLQLTPELVFPRIGSSRTSGDWLRLGAGLVPLALEALPPVPGRLDTATATASTRIPEIFVFAPPPLLPAVARVLGRGVPQLARARARRPIRDPEPLPITGPPGPGRPPGVIETMPELPDPLAQPEPALQPARPPIGPTVIPEIIVTTSRASTGVIELLAPGMQLLQRLELGTVRAPALARQTSRVERAPRVQRGTARTLRDLADVIGPSLSPGMQRFTDLVRTRAPQRTLDRLGRQQAERTQTDRKRKECECECEADQETERDACYSGFFKEQRRGQQKRNWTAIDCDTGRTIKNEDSLNFRSFL